MTRGVIDLRSGVRITPRSLFGQVGGDPVRWRAGIARSRRRWARSVRRVPRQRERAGETGGGGGAVIRVRRGQFRADRCGPWITGAQFFAPARGARASGLMLPLAPVAVPEAADLDWWAAERVALPIGGSDSASDVWTRPGIGEIVARYDTVGGPPGGAGRGRGDPAGAGRAGGSGQAGGGSGATGRSRAGSGESGGSHRRRGGSTGWTGHSSTARSAAGAGPCLQRVGAVRRRCAERAARARGRDAATACRVDRVPASIPRAYAFSTGCSHGIQP